MNDELSAVLGKYEKLVGKLQEKYGIAKAKEKHRMSEYNTIVHELKQANSKLLKLHKAMKKKNAVIRSADVKRRSTKRK